MTVFQKDRYYVSRVFCCLLIQVIEQQLLNNDIELMIMIAIISIEATTADTSINSIRASTDSQRNQVR